MSAQAHFDEGNRRLSYGELDAAAQSFRQAIALAPDHSAAHANLAFVLDQQGHVQQAQAAYRRALDLDPRCAQVHLNLGALLASQDQFEAAQEAYSDALDCDPLSAATWSNLGVLYLGAKREAEAEAFLRRALELDPNFAKARFNLSYLLLRQGRFEEGWQCLEARDWYRALAQRLEGPRWQGEPLAGKSMLVTYEAGHGDVIQFCRYLRLLKARGAGHISLLCHPALATLLATLADADRVLAFDQVLPTSGWDYWSPLLSLPYHCQTRADSIPAQLPYLHATPDRIARWAPHLPQGGLSVGLVWKGNPKFDHDAERSLPSLELLAPLAQVPGVHFISLQKGAGEDQALTGSGALELLALGSQMSDFADAAAIVAQLDLVISVDTAMAHLSGALGVPCWLLLPEHMTDWRWQSAGSTSPWYPEVMRLFRQTRRGDWSPVMDELVAALSALAGASKPTATVG